MIFTPPTTKREMANHMATFCKSEGKYKGNSMFMSQDVWDKLMDLGPNVWGSEIIKNADTPPKQFCGFKLEITEGLSDFRLE